MLYTLLKFLGWGVLLAFIGGCIGWALRALKSRGDIARAKASTVDDDEVDRMRHRLANLEHVVAERDRLRIQLADVRHADSPGIVGAAPEPEPEPIAADPATDEPAHDSNDIGDAADAASASIVPDTDSDTDSDTDTDSVEGGESEAGSAKVAGLAAVATAAPPADPLSDETSALDLDGAAAVLGKKIALDDLTVVEGIGPKISELCSGIGITTWQQLAETDVADLQSMLDAAGSRYAVHKPGTWPQQAGLLAAGEWADFMTLTDELEGGK